MLSNLLPPLSRPLRPFLFPLTFTLPFTFALTFTFTFTFTSAADPAPSAIELPAPNSSADATAVFSGELARGADGTVWQVWLETHADATASVRVATFDPAARTWRPAVTVFRAADLNTGTSDVPALAAGTDGRATVLFHRKNPPGPDTAHLHHGAGYHALLAATVDGGRTWSAPFRLSTESDINEFASLAVLADGRTLAVWLDARVKKIMGAHPDHRSGAHAGMKLPQQLYSRVFSPRPAGTPLPPGADALLTDRDTPDTLVEYSVCDCCHTDLAAFPDGTALVVYRGRSEQEARDIRVARFRGTGWDRPRTLSVDDWRLLGCPVNGPQLAADGGRVAVSWFTAADNDPRVLASFSSDAGTRFLLPLRLAEDKPAGRVSTVLLHDGAFLVSWVDAAGALVLRRITPDYSPDPEVRLTDPARGRIKGFPRLALLRDYAGGKTDAHLLVTFTREGPPASLHSLLVTVPEGALLEAGKDCDCAPSAEDLQGFPFRGSVVAVDAAQGTLRVKHAEIPGLFAAGTGDFLIAPTQISSAVAPGREFLARIDRDGSAWRLLSLRLIASPPPPPGTAAPVSR